MPQHIKPDPIKYCETCGALMKRKRFGASQTLEDMGRFLSRRNCSQSCGNSKPKVGKSAHHWRARKLRADSCAECGSTDRLHVHHKDRDHLNDVPENLLTLCASCHLKLHWREDRPKRLAAAAKAQATAVARYGDSTRQRSTDGRWSSGERPLLPPS